MSERPAAGGGGSGPDAGGGRRDRPPLLEPARRTYRLLLAVLPRRLRRRRAREMEELFADLYRDAWRRRGVTGLLRFLSRALAGLVTTALRGGTPILHRARGHAIVSSLIQDLHHAARGAVRRPTFPILAVLTLGLGIAATTAVFSLVHGIVVSPLPYPDADRLVYLDHRAPGFGFDSGGTGQAEGLHRKYTDSSHALEALAFWRSLDVTLTGAGEPEWVDAAQATAGLFPMLGARALHGRLLTAADDAPDSPRVALLSAELWARRYGGDPGIVGETIEVSGSGFLVVGVLAPGFDAPGEDVALWMDNTWDMDERFGSFSVEGIGRMRQGLALEDVRRDLDAAIADLGSHYPDVAPVLRDAGVAARPIPLQEHLVGDFERTLWILLATASFVLLTACANVANLFLVRAEERGREVAVRVALGAGRARLARHFLAESLLLSVLGGGLGVALAWQGVGVLVRRAPVEIPRLGEVGMDATVLGFALLLTLLTGVVFGLVPVLRGTGRVTEQLRDGGRSSTAGRGRVRTRQVLVVAQVALALVLMAGATLLTRSFLHLRAVDPGFRSEGVLSFRVVLPGARYGDAADAAALQARLRERLAALPGVASVGAARDAPLGGRSQGDLAVEEGQPPPDGEMPPLVWYNRATEDYFETLGIPLLAGRTLESRDVVEGSGAVVVNRALLQRFWPDRSPADVLGRRLTNQVPEKGTAAAPGDTAWLRIVGVVGDSSQEGLVGSPEPMLYLPLLSPLGDEPWRLTYVVRAEVPPSSLADPVRATVRELDPELPLIGLETMEAKLRRARAPMAFTMVLLGIAAAVAVLLGCIGVYGVVAYVVRQRTGEIGLRLAVGARATDVRRMLLSQGALIAVAGLAVGLSLSVVLLGSLETLLLGVDPLDPLTHGLVAAALFAVALLATWLPALRASRIPPLEALRER